MSLRSIATACHCEAVAQHLLKPWLLNARIARSQGTGGLGPWEAWPKVVSYRIRTPRFRSAAGLVFGAFLGRCARAVPLRFGVWRGGLREPFWGSAQRPSLACSHRSVACAKALPKVFLTEIQTHRFRSHFLEAFPRSAVFGRRVWAVWGRRSGVLRRYWGLLRACSVVLCPRPVALPKHSLLTIPCHPNRRGRRQTGR